MWDASSGSVLLTFFGHASFVESVDWSPDGTKIASGGGYEDKKVLVLNSVNCKLIWLNFEAIMLNIFTI